MDSGIPCERCGTFSEATSQLAERKLCSPCVSRAASQRYWPSGYLSGVGALLNPGLAAILLTLNYRRLGDEKQARSWGIVAACLTAFYVAVMVFSLPIPSGALVGAGIFGGVTIGKNWEAPWNTLKAKGALRANVWLPPLLVVVIALAVGAAVVLLHPEE